MANRQDCRGRILIVEDLGIVAADIEHCLEDEGFEITGVAASMEGAIREASARRPDLVLMDIRIQGQGDGIDTADYLHNQLGLPVVYLTAHDDPDTMARAKRTAPLAFLAKPFKSAQLISTVEIALDRYRMEEEVRERERSFLSAMDAIGDAVITTDEQGRVRFLNRAAEVLTGWRQELVLGKTAAEVVQILSDPAGSGGFSDFLNAGGAPGADSNNEYRVRGCDGIHWVTVKAATIAGAGQARIRVVVMQDITRRKQSEEALRRQADLLDQSQDAIFTWDAGGAISYWNQGAHALYGFTALDAVGRTAAELLPAAGSSAGEAVAIALERDGRWSGELTRRDKDGREIVVEALLVLVRDGLGRRTVLETDRNITERKQAEVEVRRLNEELQARLREITDVNQELESFNYSIAHDLRAPLRHIDAYSKILAEEAAIALPAEARGYLGRICQAAQRMGRMVDELLELSRTSRKEPARVATEMSSLVAAAIADIKPECEGREIEWRIGALPVLECDPALMRQVYVNLISNAVKFSGTRKPAIIEIGQANHEGESVLFVRDNGVGFNLKYADKLFGVFQRLHRREEFEGTGVGLATVQRIVRKHGGRIWADAELDKGATFYFSISRQAAA